MTYVRRGAGAKTIYQREVSFTQAAPVQNDWYTALHKNNIALRLLGCKVADVGEDLEVEIITDGKTITWSDAAVAGTNYWLGLKATLTSTYPTDSTSYNVGANEAVVRGQDVEVRIRKTSNNGAGTLTVFAMYEESA